MDIKKCEKFARKKKFFFLVLEHYYDAGWLAVWLAPMANSMNVKNIEFFLCALLSYSLLILMDQKNVAYYVWHFMECVCCHDFYYDIFLLSMQREIFFNKLWWLFLGGFWSCIFFSVVRLCWLANEFLYIFWVFSSGIWYYSVFCRRRRLWWIVDVTYSFYGMQ